MAPALLAHALYLPRGPHHACLDSRKRRERTGETGWRVCVRVWIGESRAENRRREIRDEDDGDLETTRKVSEKVGGRGRYD